MVISLVGGGGEWEGIDAGGVSENRLRWKHDCRDEYVSCMSGMCIIEKGSENIDFINKNILDSIREVANKLNMIARTYSKTHGKKPWVDGECTKLRREVKESLSKCKALGFQEEENKNYKNLKKLLRELLACKNKNYEDSLLYSLSQSTNVKSFWSAVNKFRGHKKSSNTIPLQKWQEHANNIFPPKNVVVLDLVNNYHPMLDPAISLMELRCSLNKCKKGKSPGVDSVSNEFFKELPESWLAQMLSLLNGIWERERVPSSFAENQMIMLYKKGDKDDPCNYREITLLNSITKIFTRILSER